MLCGVKASCTRRSVSFRWISRAGLAAGELAELFGERALPLDRTQRKLRFRARARELASALPPQHAAWLTAYVEGVNAGLADLRARPPEYWVARSHPVPWTVEDSLLVVFSFFTMLSNNESYERGQAAMYAALPQSVYEFLTPSSSRFDRPLVVDGTDPTGGYAPLPIPPQSDVDLRSRAGFGAGRTRNLHRPAAAWPGVESVGSGCHTQRSRRCDRRERPAPSAALAEPVLSVRALLR